MGWSQLALAQGTSAPGQAGDALIQQRLEQIVQLVSPSAASPPTAKPPSFRCLPGYPGLAQQFPAIWSLACVVEGVAAL